MTPRLLRIAPLLFASGFCALIYQTTWLREFRLVFGGSTAASAAVLGIFMGGIGAGSLFLGKRSETQERPLYFYGKLEMMIAVSAAATPVLLLLVRYFYLALGGTAALGMVLGTVIRLLLSILAIGLPTFLMGGTLPAVARVVATIEDTNRRGVALLYGVNTLGAVAGTVASTFFLFEALGNRMTLVVAVVINLLVGIAAFGISKTLPVATDRAEKTKVPKAEKETGVPVPFVLAASAIAGFAFLLMELVWYRMLCPLLGGSTFTFGLILAVALFGIGVGGCLYTICFAGRRVSLNGFALVSSLEALCIAVPFALGDRIALTTMLLRPLGSLGFYGYVLGWTVICAVVTLPAAIVSGVQFPMLIALLGKGKAQVGAQTGKAYAWNTAGAIAGSLAGGFGLLPALTAPGVWKSVVVLLGALAGAAAVVAIWQRRGFVRSIPALLTGAIALSLLTSTGPTAFWRHSQIGVGRLSKLTGTKTEYRDLINAMRRDILWDADGVESSVALSYGHGLNFVVNGRCDGSAIGDRGTQVMSGLIPAALIAKPEDALVIGLGTGSTAGWLGAVSTMKRVDVVELEPSIVHVAQECAPVNHQALNNPKVNVIVGDGREVLLTSRRKYDVISSEPSNPYRAGIASLFTREFYEAAAGRLKPGGLFAQWVQAYEVDIGTVGTVYATLGSVFPQVDTWHTAEGDLLFVASLDKRSYDLDGLRERLAQEPFKSAMAKSWGATNLESFLAHFVGDNSLARGLSRGQKVRLNTDDKTVLEFAFARMVSAGPAFRISAIRQGARMSMTDRLRFFNDNVNWEKVERARMPMLVGFGESFDPKDYSDTADRSRAQAYTSYGKGDLTAALYHWREFPHDVLDANDLIFVAECLAEEGKDEALEAIEQLRHVSPTDADAVLAHYFYRCGEFEKATDVLEKAFTEFRTDPWLNHNVIERTLIIAQRLVDLSHSDLLAMRLYRALEMPFSVYSSEEPRRTARLRIAMQLEKGNYRELTLAAVEVTEPNPPWQPGFLRTRAACYKAMGSPLQAQAERDLNQYLADEPPRLEDIGFVKEISPVDQTQSGYGLER